MATKKQQAWDAAQRSEMKRSAINGYMIEVVDASVLYPDFSGRPNPNFNRKKGEVRSFNIVLNDQMNKYLIDLEEQFGIKIRVRESNLYSEEEIKRDPNLAAQQIAIKYINVKVNFHPGTDNDIRANLFWENENGKKDRKESLTQESIDILDSAEIKRWDVTIHPYLSKNKRNKGGEENYYTLYLDKINAIAVDHKEYNNFYNDWAEIDEDEEALSAVESMQKDMLGIQ